MKIHVPENTEYINVMGQYNIIVSACERTSGDILLVLKQYRMFVTPGRCNV